MLTCRVVVLLVVAFGVILAPCTHCQDYTNQPPRDLTECPFTPGVDSTAIDATATDSPGCINQDFRAITDSPVVSTVQTPTTQTIQAYDGCTCNVTPDFCDIDCCCDVTDCGVADLSSVFNNCRQDTRAGACIESWLMFRANVDPQLVTDNGSLFCVRRQNDLDNTVQTAAAPPEGPTSIFSPHFSQAELNGIQDARVYKVDDVILTYYNSTSIVSVLRQPSPGMASFSCIDRNPAKFLRSGSSSCSRVVSAESCKRFSSLSFSSYYTGFSLLRVPRPVMSKITIPVIPLVNRPEVTDFNGSCMNVVTKVEYVITYTSAGEITAAMVKVDVTNATFGTRILQEHAMQFQLATPSSPPPKLPLAGLAVGTTVIGWFNGQAGPLTIMGLPLGGTCSTDSAKRAPILFNHNTMTGCTFSRPTLYDCTSLRDHIYSILRGTTTPEAVAMTTGSQPEQSRVVVRECPQPPPGEVCKTGCLVPVSLSVRFLWARRGMLALPQNHILAVKYVFSCQILKCPVVSPLPLTTEVIFSDATVYPEPPRAKPKPEWKFPFGFFTRGAEELDRM